MKTAVKMACLLAVIFVTQSADAEKNYLSNLRTGGVPNVRTLPIRPGGQRVLTAHEKRANHPCQTQQRLANRFNAQQRLRCTSGHGNKKSFVEVEPSSCRFVLTLMDPGQQEAGRPGTWGGTMSINGRVVHQEPIMRQYAVTNIVVTDERNQQFDFYTSTNETVKCGRMAVGSTQWKLEAPERAAELRRKLADQARSSSNRNQQRAN